MNAPELDGYYFRMPMVSDYKWSPLPLPVVWPSAITIDDRVDARIRAAEKKRERKRLARLTQEISVQAGKERRMREAWEAEPGSSLGERLAHCIREVTVFR